MLVLDPEVLLLDEPTAALDPRSQSQIIDLLIGWGEGRKTVVTATHDLGLVEDIADYCFVLQNGRIAAQGDPLELLRDQPLLERANLVHAHRHRHGGDRCIPILMLTPHLPAPARIEHSIRIAIHCVAHNDHLYDSRRCS